MSDQTIPHERVFVSGKEINITAKEFDVLLEAFSKRSREQLMGRTEQNKAVVVNKGNHHIGETVRVRITGSTSATLLGEIVEKE